ncbi:hypothetical protein HOP50_02g18080 [Chloropicon primus]|uniref:Uncharacterized protein n=1 Tax=Chloropicon primus TaxID=1764295 RepID=A0A5B8MFN5_9CHLO|nr:hypothetical protein A3770_02p18110 [Chloropicon primus]UPQ98502.1 hypothetical protein HOP50_02g18080 [Chloropicon primus]|eukprot:QDZ19293.1 hypothetical protein A3770_02p18110 [Chloropicon primus]
MSGPLTSQSSLHLTSEFLEDLNSDLGIYKAPPPKDIISPAFGQRYVPKLLRILSSGESTSEKKLKTLALFLTAIVDDVRKAEVLKCEDRLVFLDLLSGTDNDIKTATCTAVKKLFDFTPTREFLYDSGIVKALLSNVDSVPGAVAECLSGLAANRDIVPKLLGEGALVLTLCKLLTSEDMKAREFSAHTLGNLSREDEGVRQVLANGIDNLLEGLKQNKSLVFKNACIFTVMQLCRCYEGKDAVIGSSGVEIIATCLQIQEEETQTLAMAALLGLSTELEAKERISNACTEDLMKLQYSPSAQLKSNTDNLIASISEYPAAKAKFKKTVLVIT